MKWPLGISITGFGPIGRELALRLSTDTKLKKMFKVESISDSSAEKNFHNAAEIKKATEWKNSRRKLVDFKVAKKGVTADVSIVIDVTNSDYSKPEEAKKRAYSTIRSGKHFVSANKVALANYFTEIMHKARKEGVEVGFGATICGGMHAIAIARGLGKSEILSARAVLNASTTLILSRLEEDKSLTFDEACNEAAKSGVLESDWSIDLDGIDAAAKTAILANVLFPQSKISIKGVVRSGIRDSVAQSMITNVRNQTEGREKVRLVSELTSKKVSVGPKILPFDSPLAVAGRFNAVQLRTKTLGDISSINLGGGVPLTASVIISDLERIASRYARN